MKFISFCIVGGLGFLVDSSVYFAAHFFLSSIFARLLSFACAVCFTYICNKHYTFHNKDGNIPKQFMEYFIGMVGGGAINLLTFLAFVAWMDSPLKDYWGIAAGSVAGLCFNFSISRLVFKVDTSK